eukprot:CAMPEP_0173412214 /NCGR_PEP_ID=MMETSP1356-20130122/78958_1 /TAXON_ID=77927 ORGANISM="Hemiselmis virescens, Strain PCC157" /NCGR_SAMPLE_ID=MMETSP1356 /ASSEMBLY_ACC=CAM_ASM_000847 /LENGTH=147 /DNA_ID=CAMNT_0014374079 /DNA_START=42 /DNA_END=482 /DNA_ORIENTATION=+
MAGVALGGMRAVAGGISAMADTQEKEIETHWYMEEQTFRDQSKAWREEDQQFKRTEKAWREIDSKRSRLTQIAEQLESLARLSSYMCLAEMTIYINQSLPGRSEGELHHALLGVWGVLCVAGIVSNMVIMLASTIIHISVLQVSCHE